MNPKNIDNVIKELTKAEHAYYVLNSPKKNKPNGVLKLFNLYK